MLDIQGVNNMHLTWLLILAAAIGLIYVVTVTVIIIKIVMSTRRMKRIMKTQSITIDDDYIISVLDDIIKKQLEGDRNEKK